MKLICSFRRAGLFFLFIAMLYPAQRVSGQNSYLLQPVSGADGVFKTVTIDGQRVYRSIERNGQFEFYMYFRCKEAIRNKTVYLEVTYLDIGYGSFWVQYNSNSQNYDISKIGYDNYAQASRRQRTAVFKLKHADFRNAQNLNADLRLWTDGSLQMHIISAFIYLSPTPQYLKYQEDWISPYSGPPYLGDNLVDATTLTGKVICGYQGWFRAAGDPSGAGWVHYVYGDFSDVTFEMWPDMLEFTDEEKYAVPGWTHADGRQAYLFSSANKKTVLRHFQWMESYGIDGVALQRFVVGLDNQHPKESFRIPSYVREAAHRTGRTYFIMYAMTEIPPNTIIDLMETDWKFLVDSMKITMDDHYLHHQGKPVVGLYGFFTDWFSAADAHRILDVFQNSGPYSAFVMGSGQWWWRSAEADWLDIYKRMDAYIPWNVGHYDGDYARTNFWAADQNAMQTYGGMYMPLVYPGGGWDNLQDYPPGTSYKSRLKGKFLWDQFLAAKDMNAQAVYVAMFDEIDECTAIFKVTNDIPVNHYFVTLEGLPSDFYLLLTGFATKMMRNEVQVPATMPDFASQSQPSVPDVLSPLYGDSITNDVVISWNSSKHLSAITGYELELDNHITSHSDTTHIVSLELGSHKARVRAINALGNKSGWSEYAVFEVIEKISLDNIFLVTTTSDAGEGSLRDALDKANSNSEPDTILFNIPKTDPGYDAGKGVWIISPNTSLPAIHNEGIYIDGQSQFEYIGEDTNPDGPEIILDGSRADENAMGVTSFAHIFLNYMTIQNFGAGIYLSGVNGGAITRCYIGTNHAGTSALGNKYGIRLIYASHHINIVGNVISGNSATGISVTDSCHNISIIGNLMGLNKDTTVVIDSYAPIFISNSDSNHIFDNYVCGSELNGIDLAGSNDNEIMSNFIGTDREWNLKGGHERNGIWIRAGSKRNKILDNIIGYNQWNGIVIQDKSSVNNLISHNYISGNDLKGIENTSGGNLELPAPRELAITKEHITGTTGPNNTVEIYADEEDEGLVFIGSTTANASGHFEYTVTHFPELPYITTVAIDDRGNTSEFSQPLATDVIEEEVSLPDKYHLSQNHPNPFNPVTTIHYEIPEAVHVTIKIMNILGEEIVVLVNKNVQPGSHSISWNGTDRRYNPVAGGLYFCKMSAGSFTSVKKLILLK